MMLNPFIMKKYLTLILTASIPVCVGMIVAYNTPNIWIILGFLVASFAICMLIGKYLLHTPFTNMLEKNKLGAIDINSTGIIRLLDMDVFPPLMRIDDNGKIVEDSFDRSVTSVLYNPETEGNYAEKDGYIYFRLPTDEVNKARFGLYGRPVVVYNSMFKRAVPANTFCDESLLMTKDGFSGMEKYIYTEHNLIYGQYLLERNNEYLRDFARGFMELFKPKLQNMLSSPVFIIVIIVGLFIIGILFAKPLFASLTSAMGAGI